jgi:hypothetical protein
MLNNSLGVAMKEFPTEEVLVLACAAQRVNGEYLKERTTVFDDDYKPLYHKQPNKLMMIYSLDPDAWPTGRERCPESLEILPEDITKATEIRNFFKRLMFSAIEGDNDFHSNINRLLNSDMVPINNFGYIACLPVVYAREVGRVQVKKAIRLIDEGFLGNPKEYLEDLDCEILEVVKSRNFPGWNVCGVVNNKLTSWMSQIELVTGPCVIVKARIKEHRKHYKFGTDETRLNYVKAAQ